MQGGTSDITRNSTHRSFRFLCDQKAEAVLQRPQSGTSMHGHGKLTPITIFESHAFKQ